MRGLWLIIGIGLAVVAACSGEKDPPAPPPELPDRGGSNTGARGGSGGSGGTSGRGGSSGDSGEAGAAGEPTTVGGPNVTILSPEALAQPDDGEVLTGVEVEVVCEVTDSTEPGAAPVMASSIAIEMVDEDGAVTSSPVASGSQPDEYVATFVLASVPNGRVTFECTASDTATPRHTGSDVVRTFVDHGPAIRVISPARGSAYGLGVVPFQFEVLPDPLASDDPGAELAGVTLTVAGVLIDDVMEDDGVYTVDVALDDRSLFPTPPVDTVPVAIAATNVREPGPVTREENYSFVIDSVGPVLNITSPEGATVHGGDVVVRFTATDARTAVDPATVSITLSQEVFTFTPGGAWDGSSGDNYVFTFRTTELRNADVSANIQVSARDLAGNYSAGETVLIFLDDTKPKVDLDPLPVRERRNASPQPLCSIGFDPVGSFAANDLERVYDQQVFRALVLDRANVGMGMDLPPQHAHVDRASVRVYFQSDSTVPLLIDNDMDGICEELARTNLVFLRLDSLAPTGNASYSASEDPYLMGVPPLDRCTYGTETQPRPRLCTPPVSDLTRVVPSDYSNSQHALFAYQPTPTGSLCTGVDAPLGGLVQEGWFCVAARALDNAGNIGISPPLRLCYDDGVDPAPSCLENEAPSCTDGCTPPPRGGAYIYDQL